MNSKGQMVGVGSLLILFIGIVVCISLLPGIYGPIGQTTITNTYTNQTVTFPAVNSSISLSGREVVGSVVAFNATNGTTPQITGNNFTITNNQVVNGALVARLKVNDGNLFAGQSVNLTYTVEPDTYPDESGSRSMIQLIAIFAAIAIFVTVAMKVYEDGVEGLFG